MKLEDFTVFSMFGAVLGIIFTGIYVTYDRQQSETEKIQQVTTECIKTDLIAIYDERKIKATVYDCSKLEE